MNELNAKRIEFRNNRRELMDKLSDITDSIDALRLLRTLKSIGNGNLPQSELSVLNHDIDALIIEYNRLQKELNKLESENPQMNLN